MNSRLYRWFAAALLLVVAADWLTKFWVFNRVALGDTLAVVEGWLYLAHRQNPGIAFSLFADLPDPIRTPLLAVLSIVGIVILMRLVHSTTDGTMQFGGVLVTGGAVGNLGDRIASGAVTDFIHVPMFPYVFNLADTAITIGGALLVYRMVFGHEGTEHGSLQLAPASAGEVLPSPLAGEGSGEGGPAAGPHRS